MTHAVAATVKSAAASETHRTPAARAASRSFAEVQAAAVKDSKAKDTSASSSADANGTSGTEAPKAERTQSVTGHSYKEIVAGPRNGMFINNTGNTRDGEAFLIVKRQGREFHIYGTGADRSVYEVGRTRDAAADNGATTDPGTTGATTTGTAGTGASTTSGTSST